MLGNRNAIRVAYSLSLKNVKNYHARAYVESWGFPGLPENHVFRSGHGVGNSDCSANAACLEAIKRLIADYPEFAECEVFYFGRQSETILSGIPVIGLHGKNHSIGIASAIAK